MLRFLSDPCQFFQLFSASVFLHTHTDKYVCMCHLFAFPKNVCFIFYIIIIFSCRQYAATSYECSLTLEIPSVFPPSLRLKTMSAVVTTPLDQIQITNALED